MSCAAQVYYEVTGFQIMQAGSFLTLDWKFCLGRRYNFQLHITDQTGRDNMTMFARALILTILIPLSSAAAETFDVPTTPRDAIVLSDETEVAFDHSGKRVTSRTMPDGTVVSNHNGSLQNVTVARVGPDGRIETYCTTDREAAVDWMARLDRQPSQARRELPSGEQ
jgi:hypothetical protein